MGGDRVGQLRYRAAVVRLAAVLGPVAVGLVLVGLSLASLPLTALGCGAYAVVAAPVGPMSDALALGALGGDSAAYGAIRRWGSLGYLLGSLLGGVLLAQLGLSPLWLVFAGTLAVAAVAFALPEAPGHRAQPLLPALRMLAGNTCLMGILVAGALHFSAHVATASYLSVHMAAQGLDTSWTGVALGAGVAVEIGVMSLGARLLGRLGPRAMLQGAMALAVLRWVGMATVDSGPAMVLLQASHGLTFGGFWLASVAMVDARTPPALRASSQALLSAAVAGVGALMGMVGAPLVAEAAGTWAVFQVCIGVALLANLVAAASLAREPRP